MEKRFKNSFGVQSDSVPLLEAFIKEVEALGWKHQVSGASLSVSRRLYFNANSKDDTLAIGCYWVCTMHGFETIVIDLPEGWDKALTLASEVEEVNPFKVGDWVTHKELKVTYQITEFDKDGWCIGNVDGNGWKYTQLKKATKAQIAKVTTPADFKIGDVVVITNLNGGLSGKIGHIGKITEIDISGFCTLHPHCVGSCWPKTSLRYATPKEIATIPVVKTVIFSSTGFHIAKGKDFAVTSRGNVSKAEIQKVLRLFDAKMSICGYDLKIEDVDNIKISFGCQTDTVGKARQILAAFDE